MVVCKHSRRLIITLITAFIVSVSVSANAGEKHRSHPKISPEETAKWWQWGLSIPLSVHPLNLALPPEDQRDFCMVGQRGKTVFLGGAFVANNADFSTRIIRECVIPLGHKILIPTINGDCSTVEGNANPDDSFNKKSRDLRKCARELADPITGNIACFGPQLNPEMVMLGEKRRCPHQLKELKVERVSTKTPFVVSFPPDNPLQGIIGEPAPMPKSLMQADGYFTEVRPSAAGNYTLATFAEVVFDGVSVFSLEVIYSIKVVAAP